MFASSASVAIVRCHAEQRESTAHTQCSTGTVFKQTSHPCETRLIRAVRTALYFMFPNTQRSLLGADVDDPQNSMWSSPP